MPLTTEQIEKIESIVTHFTWTDNGDWAVNVARYFEDFKGTPEKFLLDMATVEKTARELGWKG